MKQILTVLVFLLLLYNNLLVVKETQVEAANQEAKALALNKKDYTAEYWLFGSVPAIVIGWGIGAWGWGTASKWHFENDGWGIEQDSYTGGADKFGHAWGVYAISRIGSCAFEKSGDTRQRAAFKGFLFGQIIGLGIEMGDGFGDSYGFAWGDMVWNMGGGIIALALDLFPPLDNLIGFQLEYWPSKDHINQNPEKWIEVTSDVTGQKFILSLKMSGAPYIEKTFMQYFQVDFGYYTKGYWFSNSSYGFRTRHAYIGFAFNLNRLSENLLPHGIWRNSISTIFKYYHSPLAYNPDVFDKTLGGKTPGKRN